jgi:hypothetical protein
MAERLELGQPRYNEFNQGLADDTLFNVDMGSVYGSLKKGDESNPYMMGADDLLSQGSKQYGLTGWEDLWGDQGQLLDQDALMRSMNATSAFGMAPMTAAEAERQYSQYGSSASPGGITWEDVAYGRMPMEAWQFQQSGGGYGGLNEGYSGASNYALAQGNDQNLVSWLGGINDFNDSLNDSRERFFDPNTLSFNAADFGGMDMGAATQDSLNQWAQQNYGTDLLSLAQMGSPLAQTRYDWMQNPSEGWDKNSGMLTSLSMPGMEDTEAASRMSAYNTAYGRMQQEASNARSDAYSQDINRGLMSNPEMMRTNYGQYLGGTGGLSQNLQAMAGQRVQQPTDYSSLLYGYGAAPNLANQALAHLGMQGGMY